MSKWRDTYRVHPAADVFPMLDNAELEKLAEDVKANGVRVPIGFFFDGAVSWLIDGRNRLEAAERAGVKLEDVPSALVHCSNPVSWVITLNIHRRHLTKQEQADLIVAAINAGEKLDQVEPVFRGGSGKVKAKRKPRLSPPVNSTVSARQPSSDRSPRLRAGSQ